MRIVVVGILCIVYILFGCPVGFASGSEAYITRALSYQFFHVNLFHLAVNCISVWILWKPENDTDNRKEFFIAMLISFLVYPFGVRPCIGFSNVLFAVCGLRFRYFISSWFWRKAEIIFFYAVMIGMCFLHQFAGISHIAAYLAGVFITSAHDKVSERLKPLINDVRRFSGNR